MIAFWIAAVLLSAAAAGLVIAGALRTAALPAGDVERRLHRRELAEIDDLIRRGVIAPEEGRSVRAEVSRRLLAVANAEAKVTDAGKAALAWRPAAAAVAVIAPLVAAGLYLSIGHPGLPGQAFAKRLAVWRQTDPIGLRPSEMAAVLAELAKGRPSDPDLLKELARARMDAGDPMGAQSTLRRALALEPDRADLWSLLGSARVQAGDGANVDLEARSAFNEALKRDPTLLGPRYYLARGRIAEGKVDEGLGQLRALAAELPPDTSARQGLEQEISAISVVGGLALADRPGGGGDPKAMNAAIRGMVQRLATRLEGAPDDPEGWVRLVRAYGVLGDAAQADAALAKARARYAGRAEVLAQLEQARAGGAP